MTFAPKMQVPISPSTATGLEEEILAAYEARLTFVKRIVEDTRTMLDEFRQRREKMSAELREHLAKSESLRKKDFDHMMQEILAVQGQREENVKATLEEFRKEEEKVAENLRRLVQKGKGVKIRDLKRILAKIKEEQQMREKSTSSSIGEQMSKMQQEVAGMLEEFKKEREKIAIEWAHTVVPLGHNLTKESPAVQ